MTDELGGQNKLVGNNLIWDHILQTNEIIQLKL